MFDSESVALVLNGLSSRCKIFSCTGYMQSNREFKHDVYGRRQTVKITSDFQFLCFNPLVNHTKIEKCLLLFTANTNILILLNRELKTDGRSFIFAVCHKRHA